MKLQFHSKNEIVYEQLRTSIIRGDYVPGSRLIIDQLAGELGVSQIPIREAIRQLGADGFVSVAPYTGATVTEINATRIFEIFALLESIEVMCSRAACRLIDDKQLQTLDGCIDRMDKSVENAETWARENKEFHLFISECSKSTLAKEILRNVLDHWDRLRFHYLKNVLGLRIKVAQEEHKKIVDALRARDPDRAEAMSRQHNQSALASYIGYLRAVGELAADSENVYG